MNLHQAVAILRTAKGKATEANGSSQKLEALMNEIKSLVASVQGSGISPQLLPSLISLANETAEKESEQRRRIHSILQGIDRVIG